MWPIQCLPEDPTCTCPLPPPPTHTHTTPVATTEHGINQDCVLTSVTQSNIEHSQPSQHCSTGLSISYLTKYTHRRATPACCHPFFQTHKATPEPERPQFCCHGHDLCACATCGTRCANFARHHVTCNSENAVEHAINQMRLSIKHPGLPQMSCICHVMHETFSPLRQLNTRTAT
jgi:hypothetical protein